jgi:hypothetical protein
MKPCRILPRAICFTSLLFYSAVSSDTREPSGAMLNWRTPF